MLVGDDGGSGGGGDSEAPCLIKDHHRGFNSRSSVPFGPREAAPWSLIDILKLHEEWEEGGKEGKGEGEKGMKEDMSIYWGTQEEEVKNKGSGRRGEKWLRNKKRSERNEKWGEDKEWKRMK